MFIKKELISLLESFIMMLFIISCIVFAFLTKGHYGSLVYALPFILTYGCSKAMLFLITETGKVKNPFKLFLILAGFLLLGSLCLLDEHLDMFLISASLIGFTTSTLNLLLTTCKEILIKDNKLVKSKPNPIMILGNIIIILVIYFLLFSQHFRYGVYLLIASSICVFIYGLYFNYLATDQKAVFDSINIKKAVLPVIIIFVATLVIIALREINNPLLIIIGVVLLLAIMITFIFNFFKLAHHHRITMLSGSITSFIIIYNFIKYSFEGNYIALIGLIFMMLIAMMVSAMLANKLSLKQWIIITIIGLIISCIPHCVHLGIAIALVSNSCIGNLVNDCYIKETDSINYRFEKSKYVTIGSLLQQLILLVSLVIVSMLLYQNHDLLSAFIYRQADNAYLQPLYWIYIGNCILLSVGLLVSYYQHDKLTNK